MYSFVSRQSIKIALFGLGIALALFCLNGCFAPPQGPLGDLTVAVTPEEGYPPLLVTITASEMLGGQFTFEVEGKTHQQGSRVYQVTLLDLPCVGRVVWEKEGQAPQEATFEVALVNSGPVIGLPVLNGIKNAWYFHPRYRYVVSFPDACDPERGPVKLVAASVRAELKNEDDTIFCPPYEGPDVFHARTRTGHVVENAFAFHCLWTGPIDTAYNVYPPWKETRIYFQADRINWGGEAFECKKDKVEGVEPRGPSNWKKFWESLGPVGYGTNLPFSPPGYGESGYPGSGPCDGEGGLYYDTTKRPSQMTTITVTFEDEQGARTTESWLVPTGADPGCNIYDAMGIRGP